MQRYMWKGLNKQQVGAFAEYFVKMELTMFGFQVYSTEVDDRGIDFVIRYDAGHFIEVQVKSLRDLGYVFMQKSKFKPNENLYLALALLFEGEPPKLFLIPSIVWNSPSGPFVNHEYGNGLKSEPEWGLNVSRKNMDQLEAYRFDESVEKLWKSPMPGKEIGRT